MADLDAPIRNAGTNYRKIQTLPVKIAHDVARANTGPIDVGPNMIKMANCLHLRETGRGAQTLVPRTPIGVIHAVTTDCFGPRSLLSHRSLSHIVL